MAKAIKIGSGSVWEERVGYSRAIRTGNFIEVAGTTAVDANGNKVGIGNPAEQTRFIIKKAEKALKELGADLSHVIKTVMYVTDIDQWQEIGDAHGEFFKEIKPVATMVEVSRLIDPDLVVEIEFRAYVP